MTLIYKTTIPIRIYFHICLRGEYRAIVKEMMDEIESSGLLEACHSIHLSIVGTEKEKVELVNWMKDEYNEESKILLRYWGESMKCYERPCILLLRKDAEEALHDSQSFFSLYIHSKGVTRPKYSQVALWRQLMTYFLIQQWSHCVRILSEWNAESVGTIFLEQPRPHFSGNFWWTTDRYLRTLPSQLGNSYEDPEMWIGTCAKFFISLFQHPRAPYEDNLLPSLYQDKDLGYYTVRDNLYDWERVSKTPLVFPLLSSSSTSFQMHYGTQVLSSRPINKIYPIYSPLIPSSYLFEGVFEKEKEMDCLSMTYLPTRKIIYEIGPKQCFCFAPAFEWEKIISIFWGNQQVRTIIQKILESRNVPLFKVDLHNDVEQLKENMNWVIKYKEVENIIPHDKIFFILYSPKIKQIKQIK
uniref:Uncharacterized protein n=1 Tax=viral metagenome TaxID=1070528 RepID=A0A6C0CZA9_9ZZZZ